MSDIDRGSDIVVTSRSQTAEQLQKALADSGYANISTEVISQESPAVVEDPAPPAPAEPTVEPVVEDPAPSAELTAEDPAPAAAPTDPPQGRRAPRNSRERKIIRLEEQLKLEREEREKRDRELAELRAKVNAPGTPAAAPEPLAPKEDPQPVDPAPEPVSAGPDPDETPIPKPKRADFFDEDDPDEAYIDARDEWRDKENARLARVAEKQKARQEQESKAQEEARKAREITEAREAREAQAKADYMAKVDEAKAKYSDWDAVMQTPGELCSPAMGRVIRAQKNPEILYWLGKHPEEAARICRETKLPEKPTEEDWERVNEVIYPEFRKIKADIQASLEAEQRAKESAANDEDEDDDDEIPVETPVAPAAAAPAPVKTPPPAPPVAPQVPPPAASAPAVPSTPPAAPAAAARPKFTPVTPVGSRGGAVAKPLADMTPEEIRQLSNDEYRKMRGM